MPIPAFPADKLQHAFYGAMAFIVAAALAAQFKVGALAPLVGFGAALAAGVFKEASDWWLNERAEDEGAVPRHGVDGLDALATVAGAGLAWLSAVVVAGAT